MAFFPSCSTKKASSGVPVAWKLNNARLAPGASSERPGQRLGALSPAICARVGARSSSETGSSLRPAARPRPVIRSGMRACSSKGSREWKNEPCSQKPSPWSLVTTR